MSEKLPTHNLELPFPVKNVLQYLTTINLTASITYTDNELSIDLSESAMNSDEAEKLALAVEEKFSFESDYDEHMHAIRIIIPASSLN